MDNIVETSQIGNLTINVRFDQGETESPRDWDNLGTFYGEHNKYASPDKGPNGIERGSRQIQEGDPLFSMLGMGRSRITSTVWPWLNREMIGLPVWLYDHSGTQYAAAMENPFHCQWDSGFFGVIFCTRAKAREALGVKRLTAAHVEQVKAILKSEVETYSDWANGQVYMWEVVSADGDHIDSCHGYIGALEHATHDAVESATYHAATMPVDQLAEDFKALAEGRA